MAKRFGIKARRYVAAIGVAAGLAFASWAQAVPMISVGSATVNVGGTVTIPISVSGATDLQSFQFDLTYDASLLSVVGFTDIGTDFDAAATAGGGALVGITGFDLSGTLSGVADAMSGASSGLSGSGVLVNVTFQALAAGAADLTLSGAFLTDAGLILSADNSEVALQNGRATNAPIPGTLALLLGGLGLLGLKRREEPGRA